MKNEPQHILHKTPHGILEVCVEKPYTTEAIQGVGIVCHPHPLHGGTMNNKVVTTVAKSFRELNFISVRFNYRGVGLSEGKYDHTVGETIDTLNILQWVRDELLPAKIILAGFSFGAYVSLNAATTSPVSLSHLISIAPAVNHADFSHLLPPCPWTVFIAENDNVVPANEILKWIDTLEKKPQVHLFPNASHFFDGQLIQLKNVIKSISL
jgi:alpha/beta superfamily hydrolase